MAKKQRNFEVIENDKIEPNGKINFTLHDLNKITPLTENQKLFFNKYNSGNHMIAHGKPGTGKTFLAMFKAFEEIIEGSSPYKKLIIIRSAVPTREIGFLPGTEEEKLEAFERPYIQICDELFIYKWRNYERLKKSNKVEFMSTSHLRGLTIQNAIVIVDEAENLNYHELHSVISRIGEDSKIIFCGDIMQTDLIKSKHDQCGLLKFMKIAKRMPSVSLVEFGIDDIVRSGLVKEFLLAEIAYDEEESKIKQQQ